MGEKNNPLSGPTLGEGGGGKREVSLLSSSSDSSFDNTITETGRVTEAGTVLWNSLSLCKLRTRKRSCSLAGVCRRRWRWRQQSWLALEVGSKECSRISWRRSRPRVAAAISEITQQSTRGGTAISPTIYLSGLTLGQE